MRELTRSIHYATIALSSALVIRMFVTGLARTYPWFTAFIVSNVIFDTLALILPNGTNMYAYMYFAAGPVQWILSFGVTFELYSLVLRQHPGILSFGRKWLIRALGIAALLSISTLFVNLQAPAGRHPFLDSYHLVERLVNVCLFLFLVLLMAVLAWFPIQLKRNIAVMCSVFGSYILVRSALFLARNILGLAAAGTLNLIYIFPMPICVIAWLFLLRPSGEFSLSHPGYQRSPADEARILAQLDEINASLLRSAK